MKIKVAITQMSCSSNYEENIKKADEMVAKCAKAGANIILLQELFDRYEEEIKKCCEMFKEPKIIVTHLDCLAHCCSTSKTVKKIVKENNLQDRVIIPKDGEIVHL